MTVNGRGPLLHLSIIAKIPLCHFTFIWTDARLIEDGYFNFVDYIPPPYLFSNEALLSSPVTVACIELMSDFALDANVHRQTFLYAPMRILSDISLYALTLVLLESIINSLASYASYLV